MRVSRLFIIVLVPPFDGTNQDLRDEAINGAKALFTRYSAGAKSGNVREVTLLQLDNAVDADADRSGGQLDGRLQRTAHGSVGNDRPQDVGRYIIGHFSHLSMTVGPWRAERLALFVKNLMQMLNCSEIRKLALVACNDAEEQLELMDAPEKSYVEQFAKYLGQNGFRPKIAGWDSFVSILYEGTPHVSKKEKKRNEPAHFGRKIIQHARHNKLSTPTARNAHKMFFQWVIPDDDPENAHVAIQEHSGWTDNPEFK
jgi:hypothetical protein